MAITVSGTTVTFNDASTQTTAPVNTSANVNSITAGSGISVSASTGAVTISATGGGTVTSVATGNGLSGGTITSSGTLTVACPTFNTVGSYVFGVVKTTSNGQNWSSGDNMAAGTGNKNVQNILITVDGCGGYSVSAVNELSGTWKVLFKGTGVPAANNNGLLCRVS